MVRYSKILWQCVGELLVEELREMSSPAFVWRVEKFSTWSFRYVHGLEYFVMPRKKATGNHAAQAGVQSNKGELKWLNVALDTEDIDSIVSLIASQRELADEVVGLIATGGNFSVRRNPDKGNFSCFMSDNRGNGGNGGFGISASANEPIAAVAACLIKLRIWKSAPERFATPGGDLGIR